MKFVCLISADHCVDDMPPDAAARHFAEYRTLIDELRQSGHYVGGMRLQPAGTAAILRFQNGKPVVTDGPFAETKEHLGGLFIVEAADMEEAIEIAARFPGAKLGHVEIRPLAEDEATREALAKALN